MSCSAGGRLLTWVILPTGGISVDVALKWSPYGGWRKQPLAVTTAPPSNNETRPYFINSPPKAIFCLLAGAPIVPPCRDAIRGRWPEPAATLAERTDIDPGVAGALKSSRPAHACPKTGAGGFSRPDCTRGAEPMTL